MAQQRPPPVEGDRPGDVAEAAQAGQMPAGAAPINQVDTSRAARRVGQVRLAQLTLAVSVCLWAAGAALGFGRPRVAGVAGFTGGDALATLVLLTFVGVGTLIVTRRPGNRIGWLFCAIGLQVLLGSFATQYAVVALLAGRPALPAGPAMAWLAGWTPVPGLSLLFYLLVLFPDGHLPSRRWRPVVWLYGGALAVGTVTAAVQPGTTPVFIGDLGPIRNPLGWQQAAAVLGMVNGASRLVVTVLLPVGAVGLGLRLRRARGVERQQLKWLAYAGAVLAGAILAEGLVQWLGRDRGTLGAVLGLVLILGGMLGVPVAAGVAILRYRLYAIDRLVNRTLVYGLVTAVLGGVYAGLVLALGEVLGHSSSLAVAAATLTVAAAFQLDLDALATGMLTVVDQTMQPTTASLWLRPSMEHSGRSTS